MAPHRSGHPERLSVILDTNALMTPAQFGVDIFSELERLGFCRFLVPAGVVEELERLCANSRGREKSAASVALSLVRRCKVLDAKTKEPVDEEILKLAEEMHAAVFTNDRELKEKLKSRGVRLVYLRQKKKLELG
jgi:hypothetical protein